MGLQERIVLQKSTLSSLTILYLRGVVSGVWTNFNVKDRGHALKPTLAVERSALPRHFRAMIRMATAPLPLPTNMAHWVI